MSTFERALLHLSTWLATATGLVYLCMKYVMTTDDPFSVLHHPWQPHVLGAHLLVAPFLIFALGLITREHILGRLSDGRRMGGWASGIVTVLLAVPMIATGYLMQVFTNPGVRRVLVVTHVASGLLFALLFLGHLVAARHGKRSANGARAEPRRRGRGGARRRLDWPSLRGILTVSRGRQRTPQRGAEGEGT
jgi:MFS family permease